MAPVARPSSLLRPSRTYLHRCTHRVLIFMSRLLHAHLHHHTHCPPIFFIFAPLCPSSSSLLHRYAYFHPRAVLLIFVFIAALSCLSLTMRRRAHLHGCAVAPILSLRHQVLHLHCTIERTSFIVAPSRASILSLMLPRRGCMLTFCFGRSLASHLCMPAFFPLSAITVLKYSFYWHCSSLPCHHLSFFFASSFIFALSHADLYCCVVAR